MAYTVQTALTIAQTITQWHPASDEDCITEICEMLSYRRPSFSKTEQEFIKRYIKPLGAKPDGIGNYILRIGESPILWSSHTDTVHRLEGRQDVTIEDGYACLPKDSKSNCLGADCTAGIWIMRQMILAGVDGLYIFHRMEESGGVGSNFIADETPQLLDGIQAAAAFDRRGRGSIITRQAGENCCSQAFADSMGIKLPDGFLADPEGIFTDTANYTRLIPECTNLSVGYYAEHTSSERLDLNHLLNLRDAMIKFIYDGIVIERDPVVAHDFLDEKYNWADYFKDANEEREEVNSVYDFVLEYPDETADLLRECGITLADLRDRITKYRCN